jgi:hypothetical protein
MGAKGKDLEPVRTGLQFAGRARSDPDGVGHPLNREIQVWKVLPIGVAGTIAVSRFESAFIRAVITRPNRAQRRLAKPTESDRSRA